MSRHELMPLPKHPNVGLVVVGWDRPLQTFYVQVHARAEMMADPDEDELVVWRGTNLGELPEPADALAIASRYARIPPDLGSRLRIDRLATSASPDGVAQQRMKDWLFGPVR